MNIRAVKKALKPFVPRALIATGHRLRTQAFALGQWCFDWRHSVDTRGRIAADRLATNSGSKRFAVHYEATPHRAFRRMMRTLSIEHRHFVFVDIGSGKGAVLLYAAEYPFQSIVGVEYAEELHRIAQRNVQIFLARGTASCRAVECVLTDAMQFALPREPLVLFLFNPFHETMMQHFMARVLASLQETPRSAYILTRNPRMERLMDALPWLTAITKGFDHAIYQGNLEHIRIQLVP